MPLRFLRTARYLRPIQLYGRLLRYLPRPRIKESSAPNLRQSAFPWSGPYTRRRSLLEPWRFRFLNVERELKSPADWDRAHWEKLWLYNLHYFDDFNADGANARVNWHTALIGKWIRENPPGRGTGWEPYPTSIRIVNWIKWCLRGCELRSAEVGSLATQARWLYRNLEHHLLGNHLFSNAKALVFAGHFFESQEADKWLRKGADVVSRELDEQILADGGHFERSPMYHALFLEDILDLIQLDRCYGSETPPSWRRTAKRMLRWLKIMQHPDGDIPFFNDAAIGVAPAPVTLERYADSLECEADNVTDDAITDLNATGYIRLDAGQAVAFVDVAAIGPDYLPGHAHADTLSFEMALDGQRLFVNRGTSEYGQSDRRLAERGTAAHNTVTLDEENSSEVWSSFRVARRARITARSASNPDGEIRVRGCHDGYRRLSGRPIHCREWILRSNELEIVDNIESTHWHEVRVYLHLHPRFDVHPVSPSHAQVADSTGKVVCDVQFEGAGRLFVDHDYHAPEFGLRVPSRVLGYRADMAAPAMRLTTRVRWGSTQ